MPIITLTSVEGKMFTPMAITILMVLLGASILSMTLVSDEPINCEGSSACTANALLVLGGRALA